MTLGIKYVSFLSLLLFTIFNCGSKDTNFNLYSTFFLLKNNNEESSKNYSISGLAQKGPFVKNSKIIITELNDDLTKTKNVHEVQIKDEAGSFEFKGKNF